ncbi:hypothetical protein K793_23158, partial [Salmonella enterica subsp. enterica serovar Newport str. SHSN003]
SVPHIFFFFFFFFLCNFVLQRRAILRGVAQQRAREARMRAAQAQQEAA